MKLKILVIKVEDEKTETKSGTKDGKAWAIHEQRAYVQLFDSDGQPKKYPTEIRVAVEADDRGIPQPYPVGEYTLAPECFYVGKYDSLTLGRLQLVALPVSEPAKSEPAKKAA